MVKMSKNDIFSYVFQFLKKIACLFLYKILTFFNF